MSASPPADPIIHVELARYFAGASAVTVSCDQSFDVVADGVVSGRVAAGKSILVSSASRQSNGAATPVVQISLDGERGSRSVVEASAKLQLRPTAPAPVFTISRLDEAGHAYRGDVAIVPLTASTMRIVNGVDLETYLMGVLKAEIGPDAPLEAMKAQAVAARSYTVANMGRLWKEGADVDDTTRSQGYLGRDGETWSTCRAVQETSGQVLTYDGAVIDAMYSTDCGGATAPGPIDQPYLQSVKDPLCANKPPWSVTLSAADIAEAIHRATGDSSDAVLAKLAVISTDVSGRVSAVSVTFADGASVTILGTKLRIMLGPNNLRSTLFIVKEARKGFWEFRGEGWGHGMGLCQAGAIARASQKKTETGAQILADYYPSSKVTSLTAALVPSPVDHGAGY